MDVKTQLKSALSHYQGKSLLLPYLNMLNDEEVMFDTTKPIPVKEVEDIYRVRARLNERKGSPIEGYHGLLDGLELFSGEYVRVHGLTKRGRMLVVFTDAAVEKVIGALTKTAVEARPEQEILAASAA